MTTSPVTTITDELVAELEELAHEATPGPWEFIGKDQYDGERYWLIQTKEERNGWEIADIRMDVPHHEGNASFIAASSPPTILALLAERAELKRDAERYRWLRDNDQLDPRTQKPDLLYAAENYAGSMFDAAIDAAMQATDG